MSVAIPPFAWVESARMEFPAAVAAGMSAVGHDGGLLTPANTAASMAAPIRATSNGRTASHGETDMSAVTASGTGTIAAISSATKSTPTHETSVVCLSPVSPLTQYACPSESRTGSVVILVPCSPAGTATGRRFAAGALG